MGAERELDAVDRGRDLVKFNDDLKAERRALVNHWKRLEKSIAKVEAYRAANVEKSLELFVDKIAILKAMSETWRDPETGEFDPYRLKYAEARKIDIYFNQVAQLEKMAGMLPSVKQERTVTVTLADRFKELAGHYQDVVDGVVVGEETDNDD